MSLLAGVGVRLDWWVSEITFKEKSDRSRNEAEADSFMAFTFFASFCVDFFNPSLIACLVRSEGGFEFERRELITLQRRFFVSIFLKQMFYSEFLVLIGA